MGKQEKNRRKIEFKPCEKSETGNHNFPQVGGDCLLCGVNQNDISGIKFRSFEKIE